MTEDDDQLETGSGPPWQYAQILERAHHWATILTGDWGWANELATQVAEAVWERLNGEDRRGKSGRRPELESWKAFNRYIATAVSHRRLDDEDSATRRTKYEQQYAAERTPGLLDTDTPDLFVEALEQRKSISAAIEALPPVLHDYVVCVHIWGMSYTETAERFGMKRETVEAGMARANRRMRASLKEHRLSNGSGPSSEPGTGVGT